MKRRLLSIFAIVCIFASIFPAAVSADEYSFLTFDEKNGTITSCDKNYSGELVIPEKINGVTVTGIGKKAFNGCRNLTKIQIPDTVENIGEVAFYGCSSLPEITIPESVLNINSNIFGGCTSLENVNVSDMTIINYGYAMIEPDFTINGYSGSFAEKFARENNMKFNSVGQTVDKLHSYGKCGDNVYWELSTLGKLTISGNGDMYDYWISAYGGAFGNSPWHSPSTDSLKRTNYYEEINSIVIEDGVTSIGDCAFAYCDVRDIAIPPSVTKIGDSAFYRCGELQEIAIPSGVTEIGASAFYGCNELKEVAVPQNVSAILANTFLFCVNLRRVELPYGLKAIYNEAFGGCDNLTEINIPETVSIIDNHLKDTPWFDDFEDGEIYINNTLFGYKGEMPENYSLNVKEGVEYISDYAFFGCENLANINLPESLKYIGTGAFEECYIVKSINIPENVQSIGAYAFENCFNLENINIPDSVLELGCGAFSGTQLYDDQENGVTYIGSWCCGYKGLMPENESVVIKEGTTGIMEYAFYYDENLSSVELPQTLKFIGDMAFSNTGIEEIDIPEATEHLGENCFYGNSNLSSVSISVGVKSIGESFLEECPQLKQITVDPLNENYTVYDNALYSKDMKTLIMCAPNVQTYTIPDGVETISLNAFQDSRIQEIVIPESVVNIEEGAFRSSALKSADIKCKIENIPEYCFWGCENLRTITLPSSLKTIEGDALPKDNTLDIVFDGTRGQWNNIVVRDGDLGYNYDTIMRSSVHCSIDPFPYGIGSTAEVFVNGAKIEFDQAPVIENGCMLVPLRAIFEALGADVEWNGNTKTVTSSLGDTTVVLTIGSNFLKKNNSITELDVPARIINDRTMIPVRAVAEAFGCGVEWDEDGRTVIISQ